MPGTCLGTARSNPVSRLTAKRRMGAVLLPTNFPRQQKQTRCITHAAASHFTDYRARRAVLGGLLANRLPRVELLTAGGRGCRGSPRLTQPGSGCDPPRSARGVAFREPW